MGIRSSTLSEPLSLYNSEPSASSVRGTPHRSNVIMSVQAVYVCVYVIRYCGEKQRCRVRIVDAIMSFSVTKS